jgi:predicted dehydrogenase
MKFLIIGLGSMGKRRIRNLQYLGHNNITGYDLRNDRLIQAHNLYGIEILRKLDEINFSNFTHVIISTPPDAHIKYALTFHGIGAHVFIEASVVDDDYSELIHNIEGRQNLLAPSCTMRFDPLNIQVCDWLENNRIGRALYCNHHFGQYLPHWHPYESVNDFYVSNKRTGGAREIVSFDLVYLSWFFGLPTSLSSLVDMTGTLDCEIDDIYALTFRTPKCRVVQMTVDVVSKLSYRTTRIVGEKGNIELDSVAGTLNLYDYESRNWTRLKRTDLAVTTSTEEMYVNEINSFVSASNGDGEYPYKLEDDHAILSKLYAFEDVQTK